MEFQLSCFKSWKMMLWKCCTPYASKFGKLRSGYRTGKGHFSFQSQRKAMPKICYCFLFPHSICYEGMGPDAIIFVFSMLSFKPTFSLFSFTFIKRLISYSLSAIKVGSSTYLRLLIFLLAVLIPACPSSSQVFCMLYSSYKLNKQGDNIQLWHTPFLIWNQSIVPCPVLTCFLTCIQISQEAGKVVWYSHVFKNFLQFVVIHTVKGFGIVNKAEIDVFSGTLLLFRWSSGRWQFHLWSVCLF